MKKGLGRLVLALLALTLSLCGLELGVRLANLAPLAPVHPLRRGAFVTPGVWPAQSAEFSVNVEVNAAGFVDRQWKPRDPGRRRVLLVGDSFVQAAQVPMEAGLGRRLQELLGPQVEVLSLGIPGAGTATAIEAVQQVGLELKPDLVILAFLLANDVFNNHPGLDTKADKPYFRVENGRLYPWNPQDLGHGRLARGRLWSNSALFRFVGRKYLQRSEVQGLIEKGAGIPLPLRLHDPRRGPQWTEAWENSVDLVGYLAESCTSEGVGFGVALLADGPMVDPTLRGELSRQWPDSRGWDFGAAAREGAERLGPVAPLIDLSPALEAESRSTRLYYPQDGHWNPAGHAAAARALAPFVANMLSGRAGAMRSAPAPGQ